MSNFQTAAMIIVLVCLIITALAAVVRIVRGPTILDRMVASDVLLTTLALAIGADMVFRGSVQGIALMTAIAATSVLATIVVARFVRRRPAQAGNETKAREPSRGETGTKEEGVARA